jgi:hypothetical protein
MQEALTAKKGSKDLADVRRVLCLYMVRSSIGRNEFFFLVANTLPRNAS